MSIHTTLPSISNLLNGHPSTPLLPAFNLSPASPVGSHPPSPPSSLAHSPKYNHNHLHPFPSASPLLSPVDSCSSSSSFCRSPLSLPSLSPRPSTHLSVPALDELPPLQGYDPPLRRLCSNTPQIAPWSAKDAQLPSLSPDLLLPPAMSYPQPISKRMEKKQKQQQSSDTPSTQIIISPSGQPILKRRRGRPPSNREPHHEGGLTFLTPTVWEVKQTTMMTIATPPTSHSSVSGGEEEGGDSLGCTNSNSNKSVTDHQQHDMHGSMAAFTSSNMETVLQMPRKKRGRKPKTHIEGNSCFVWRDMTSTRSSSKK